MVLISGVVSAEKCLFRRFFPHFFIFYFVCLRILFEKNHAFGGSIKRITACTTVSISAEAISMKCFMVEITIFMRIMGGDGGGDGDDNTIHTNSHTFPLIFITSFWCSRIAAVFTHTHNHLHTITKKIWWKTTEKNPS